MVIVDPFISFQGSEVAAQTLLLFVFLVAT